MDWTGDSRKNQGTESDGAELIQNYGVPNFQLLKFAQKARFNWTYTDVVQQLRVDCSADMGVSIVGYLYGLLTTFNDKLFRRNSTVHCIQSDNCVYVTPSVRYDTIDDRRRTDVYVILYYVQCICIALDRQ